MGDVFYYVIQGAPSHQDYKSSFNSLATLSHSIASYMTSPKAKIQIISHQPTSTPQKSYRRNSMDGMI